MSAINSQHPSEAFAAQRVPGSASGPSWSYSNAGKKGRHLSQASSHLMVPRRSEGLLASRTGMLLPISDEFPKADNNLVNRKCRSDQLQPADPVRAVRTVGAICPDRRFCARIEGNSIVNSLLLERGWPITYEMNDIRPTWIRLETSSHCQLRCPSCPDVPPSSVALRFRVRW